MPPPPQASAREDPKEPLAEASVDASALEELRGVVGDAVDEIVECFVADAGRLLGEIGGAARAANAAAVRAAAHQLKSSSASIGALRFSDLMQRIEATGAEGCVDGVSELLDEAVRDLARVRDFFASPARP